MRGNNVAVGCGDKGGHVSDWPIVSLASPQPRGTARPHSLAVPLFMSNTTETTYKAATFRPYCASYVLNVLGTRRLGILTFLRSCTASICLVGKPWIVSGRGLFPST